MPNWVANDVVVRGTEEQMLNLFNDALANSGEEKKDNVQDAFDTLVSKAKHKESKRDGIADFEVKVREVELVKGFTLRTILPIPDTFLMYDTTNHPEKFPEVAAEQQAKYGAMGWYLYNVKTLGTKWDAEIETSRLTEKDGIYSWGFLCDSAWSPITRFLECLIDTYGVRAFNYATDEGYNFVFYEEVNGDEKDFTGQFIELFEMYNEETEEDSENYYDAVDKLESNVRDEYDDFILNA